MDTKLAILEEKLASLELTCKKLSEKVTVAEATTEKHEEKLASLNGDKDEEEAVPAGPDSRARILHNVAIEQTDDRRDEYPDGRIPGPKALENTKDIAFTFRKFINYGRGYDELEVHDPELRSLLRSELRHYIGHMLLGDTIIISSPFEPIILNWDKLDATAKLEEPNKKASSQARYDLGLLLKTISENATDRRLDQLLKTRVLNIDQKRITFESLWTIFPPGEIIFGKPFQKQPQIFVVQDNVRPWPEPESTRGRSPPWVLKCWMYDWTGQIFLRTLVNVQIERFEGAKPINSLPYYPFRFHEQRNEMEDKLFKRGKEYRKVCIAKKGEQMFHYKGGAIFSRRGITETLDESSDYDDSISLSTSFRRNRTPVPSKTSQIDSTVMVDFVSYNRYGPAVAAMGFLVPLDDDPDCNCSECRKNDELSKTTRRDFDRFNADNPENDWTREQFMLCPPRVLGYVLRDKQWAQLEIGLVKKNLDEEKPPEYYLNKLKLAGADSGLEIKELLMNLVKYHGGSGGTEGKSKFQMDDIIANKGKGLVILLYGPPGVGKTSTAETIAMAAKKPLFPVNVADVGTKAKYVEANLEKIFDLATTWEAILLIDEADVFLESRSRGNGNNTERNALVSVFLRVLEYYQGILFLTTNQIAQFDVAVQSRIHIALKYDLLDATQTEEIFMQFLKQLNEKKQVKNLNDIEKWVQSDNIRRKAGFDGRQIRNIVSCAFNLARAENRPLQKDDLLAVAGYVREFKTEFKSQFDRFIRAQGGNEP